MLNKLNTIILSLNGGGISENTLNEKENLLPEMPIETDENLKKLEDLLRKSNNARQQYVSIK